MARKRKTRMYEPWGYADQNNYQGAESVIEKDLDSFFSGVEYNKDDNKIHFTNKEGKELAALDVDDFVGSGGVIEKTEYVDGVLTITFTNGDVVSINFKELIDENEFKDGLIVNDHEVKVLIDPASEAWLTVSPNGVKISGLQSKLDSLDSKIDSEAERAKQAEQSISGTVAELGSKINDEISRALEAERILDERIDEISSGASIEKLDELIEKLGYKDNETLQRTNEHEVAFGEYNVSNTSDDPSGQTIFSVGIGTGENDRKNAIEVRKDGALYLWIEGDFMNVNNLLAQIAHETYDDSASHSYDNDDSNP